MLKDLIREYVSIALGLLILLAFLFTGFYCDAPDRSLERTEYRYYNSPDTIVVVQSGITYQRRGYLIIGVEYKTTTKSFLSRAEHHYIVTQAKLPREEFIKCLMNFRGCPKNTHLFPDLLN
jgi:hypothetical protein